MPLDSRATQTTATNSATYLVNKRRRVFGTEISAGAGGCAILPVACGRGAKRRFMRSRILIPATLPGACRVVSRGPVAASSDGPLSQSRDAGTRPGHPSKEGVQAKKDRLRGRKRVHARLATRHGRQ